MHQDRMRGRISRMWQDESHVQGENLAGGIFCGQDLQDFSDAAVARERRELLIMKQTTRVAGIALEESLLKFLPDN